MENPWKKIGQRHIHPDDEKMVLQYNRSVEKKHPPEMVHRELPPLPYLGNARTARVILLGKNPSYSDIDETEADALPALYDENFKSLTFESDCPLFYLDARFKGTNVYHWWWGVLGALITACEERGTDAETVLGRIACAQYHPYRSRESFVPKEPFPTQEYTFQLVREAVKNEGTVFVLLYGAVNERLWRQAVPPLPATCIRLKSAQASSVTPGNMAPTDWEQLVKTLCQS